MIQKVPVVGDQDPPIRAPSCARLRHTRRSGASGRRGASQTFLAADRLLVSQHLANAARIDHQRNRPVRGRGGRFGGITEHAARPLRCRPRSPGPIRARGGRASASPTLKISPAARSSRAASRMAHATSSTYPRVQRHLASAALSRISEPLARSRSHVAPDSFLWIVATVDHRETKHRYRHPCAGVRGPLDQVLLVPVEQIVHPLAWAR